METWTLSSVIRGHHISKAVWTPTVGEVLDVAHESGNMYDRCAVAVHKPGIGVIGHAPRECSRAFWRFLQQGGSITCTVNGGRQFGKGLEVPCSYSFHGSKKAMKQVRKRSAWKDAALPY